MITPHTLFTLAEAADQLSISRWTLRKLLDNGTIRHLVLPGGRRVIPFAALDDFVAGVGVKNEGGAQ